MTSLYNIPSRYIGRYYKLFHLFGITHNPLAKYPQFLFSNLAHKLFHHFPELHQKSEHFWTFPNPHFLFKSFESKSNEFEFNLSIMPLSIFLGTSSFFCESGKIIPVPNSFSNLSFLPFFFLFIFCFDKRIRDREREGALQPSSQAKPAPSAAQGPAGPCLLTLRRSLPDPHPSLPCSLPLRRNFPPLARIAPGKNPHASPFPRSNLSLSSPPSRRQRRPSPRCPLSPPVRLHLAFPSPPRRHRLPPPLRHQPLLQPSLRRPWPPSDLTTPLPASLLLALRARRRRRQ